MPPAFIAPVEVGDLLALGAAPPSNLDLYDTALLLKIQIGIIHIHFFGVS
jgi:hypothetical protein